MGSFYISEKKVSKLELEVTKYFLTQGPFAFLFVWLLIYVMKRNAERETRLHNTLDKFSEKYDLVINELKGINKKIGGKKDED